MPRQHIWLKNFPKIHLTGGIVWQVLLYAFSALLLFLSCQRKDIGTDNALAWSWLLLPCYNLIAPPSGTVAALPVETKDA